MIVAVRVTKAAIKKQDTRLGEICGFGYQFADLPACDPKTTVHYHAAPDLAKVLANLEPGADLSAIRFDLQWVTAHGRSDILATLATRTGAL